MKTGPNVRLRADGRYEARYEKGRKENGRIRYGFCYGLTYDEAFVKRFKKMTELELFIPERYTVSPEASPDALQPPKSYMTDDGYIDGPKDTLSEEQAMLLDKVLRINPSPQKTAIFLCLHMGLSIQEVSSLRLRDFDLKNKVLYIGSDSKKINHRTMPLPSHVIRYMNTVRYLYSDPDCLICTGKPNETSDGRFIQKSLRNMSRSYKIAKEISCTKLQNTFVRRLFENRLGLYTVYKLGDYSTLDKLVRKYYRYIKEKPEDIERLAKYASDLEPITVPLSESGKRMNLLILGAGGEGNVIKEVARSMGIFNKISFLDDVKKGTDIVGRFDDAERFIDEYPIAVPGISENILRKELTDRLEKLGFIMPLLVSPSASVSSSAKLYAPCIVEPKAIIGSGVTAKRGCIISSGSIVDHDVDLEEFVHIDIGVTVKKYSTINPEVKIASGTVWNNADADKEEAKQ